MMKVEVNKDQTRNRIEWWKDLYIQRNFYHPRMVYRASSCASVQTLEAEARARTAERAWARIKLVVLGVKPVINKRKSSLNSHWTWAINVTLRREEEENLRQNLMISKLDRALNKILWPKSLPRWKNQHQCFRASKTWTIYQRSLTKSRSEKLATGMLIQAEIAKDYHNPAF